MTALVPRAFDSEAFGAPYYRVVAWDDPQLATELGPLVRRHPIIIDAKLPAAETDRILRLQALGFRSVAVQIAMRHGLDRAQPPRHDVTVVDQLDLSDESLDRHAANFRFDRFSCDPLMSRAARDRVYRGWIAESLSGHATVACLGANFCTFKCEETRLSIDLLSVLDQRQGIGRSLVLAVLEEARRRGLGEARVVTECANEPAWRLYASIGFRIEAYLNCLHFVAL
jgi:GNAT superfamily N-acetyltransferase